MKSLFERFFKKEPEFSYTVADYLPVKTNRLRTDVQVTEYAASEYQIEQATEHDEMEIDEIYQNS
jgi:hypothetical protein